MTSVLCSAVPCIAFVISTTSDSACCSDAISAVATASAALRSLSATPVAAAAAILAAAASLVRLSTVSRESAASESARCNCNNSRKSKGMHPSKTKAMCHKDTGQFTLGALQAPQTTSGLQFRPLELQSVTNRMGSRTEPNREHRAPPPLSRAHPSPPTLPFHPVRPVRKCAPEPRAPPRARSRVCGATPRRRAAARAPRSEREPTQATRSKRQP
eukprot:6203599-Pleurochrysis_carterae.AAC.3